MRAQTLGGITLLDALDTAVHPNGCLDDYITGFPNDSTWVNFIPGQFMTGNFSGAHTDGGGYDLLIETSFNKDNYAVNLLLSTGLYSDTHFINTQDWELLNPVFWAYNTSTTCNNSYSSSFHFMSRMDFSADFGLGPTETVTGIRITFLTTTGEPDIAGVYIIDEVICGIPMFDGNIVEICQGDSFTLYGYTYSQPGFYLDTVYAQNGCDSIRFSVNVLLAESENESYIEQICFGDSFTVHGFSYNETGFYMDTLISSSGCDSIQFTLNLSILGDSLLMENFDTVVCEGEVFEIYGNAYTQAGFYRDTIQSSEGCDSLVYDLNLSIDTAVDESYSFTICSGESILLHGFTYTQSGIYIDTLLAQSGCDSIRFVLDLDVLSPSIERYTEQICSGETFQLHGSSYNQTGLFRDTIENTLACDSLIYTIELLVQAVHNVIVDTTICPEENINFANQLLNTPGSYTELFNSQYGCDSSVTLNLSVYEEINFDSYADTAICTGQNLELDLSYTRALAYEWNTGEISSSILVSNEGSYVVAITDANACVQMDTIVVSMLNCDSSCRLVFPTGFSPNGDGFNDQFVLINPCDLAFEFYELGIFNRWGEIVFFSTKADKGWDGMHQSKQAPIGVYSYVFSYQLDESEELLERSGNVSLIR